MGAQRGATRVDVSYGQAQYISRPFETLGMWFATVWDEEKALTDARIKGLRTDC